MSSTIDADRVIEEVKASRFTGTRGAFREVFAWLWSSAQKRCPLLKPKLTARYVSFEIPVSNTIVWIDPQASGIKLGFHEGTQTFGLKTCEFPQWDHSAMVGLVLSTRDERVLLAIEDAYQHRCIEISMPYESSTEYLAATS